MTKKNDKNKKKHDRRRNEHNAYLKRLAAVKLFRESSLRMLHAMGIPNIFKMIHETDVELYYLTRVGSVRLIPGYGTHVPRRTLTAMRYMLSRYLRETTIKLENGHFFLEDFMTAGYALAAFEESLKQSDYECSRKASPYLTSLKEYVMSSDTEATKKLLHVGRFIESIFSRINGSLYCMTSSAYSDVKKEELKVRISHSYEVHQVKAVKKDILIDGKLRPAYRAGWPSHDEGILWFRINAKKIGIDCMGADKLMDIYVQSHALIRLRERIDTVEHSALHLSLVLSIARHQISVLSNGKYLLAYYHINHKLGYFLFDVINDIVVIRTFLFITNSGTPEGDRLDKELNIGKIEKEYVGVDKLSTFVQSDLLKDERVKNIFNKVGLGHLNELDSEIHNRKAILKKGYAADFLKYMNVGGGW